MNNDETFTHLGAGQSAGYIVHAPSPMISPLSFMITSGSSLAGVAVLSLRLKSPNDFFATILDRDGSLAIVKVPDFLYIADEATTRRHAALWFREAPTEARNDCLVTRIDPAGQVIPGPLAGVTFS